MNTNTRCIDNVISQNNDPNDIRMSGSDKKDDDNDDADSDIVILSNKKNTNSDTNGGLDKLENTKQARQKKHRIECVPNVTKITIISERNDESQNNLINPEINDETSNDGTLISANRAVASDGGPLQLNSAFFKDYTPAPSVPSIGSFGLPSSWNDRLNNNPFMDTMSIMGGFDDGNFPFGHRECSPLMNIDNTMPLINDDIEINDKRDGDDRGLADDQGGLNENRVNMEVQISQTHQTPQPQHQPVHEQPPHEQIMHGQMMDETDFSKISHGYNTETGTNSNNYYDHPQHIHNGMNPGFPHYYYPMPYYAYDQQNIPLYYVNPNYHNHNHQNYMQIAHHSQQQQQEQTGKESMNIDGPQLFNERSSTDSTFATISPKQGTGSNLTTPTNTINFQDECSKNNKSQFTYTNPEL